MRAHGRVTVGGAVEFKFTVFDGKKGVWAKLPVQRDKVKKDDNGYPVEYPEVRIIDKSTYMEFQHMVAKEYENVMGATTQGKSNTGEETQVVDEIPF